MLKYVFLVAICVGFGQTLFGQAFLEGKLVDGITKKPLPFVNVYINNTTVGTTSHLGGEYSLPIPLGESEVIFSFVGYQSHKVKVLVPVAGPVQLDVKLFPSKQELEKVTIKGSADKEWERLMKLFERIFLGESTFSTKCKILNPWCIDLKMTKISNRRVLVATASRPLEIENMALGYKIRYDLQNFMASKEAFIFSGFVHFKEIQTTDSIQAAQWSKNRLDAYHGSSRHMFKSILEGRLEEEGFSLYAERFPYKKIYRSNVFAVDLGNVVIPYYPTGFTLDTLTGKYTVPIEKKIELHYRRSTTSAKFYVDIPFPVAQMDFKERRIEINKDGVLLNPSAMVTTGYLNALRVPYLLPYDYRPEKKAEFVHVELSSLEEVKFETLQEKVYLHTDKSYYYPGDVIWFKGYLRYHSPQLVDSMSAALYVDLISPQHGIMETKIFRIDSGRVRGDLFLPGSLPSGNYYLRAYTNWMRNYNASDMFIKPLPVLGFYDNIDFTNETPDKALNSAILVEIVPDKKIYSIRDSVALTILVKDEFDNPLQAELSISVTDAQSVVPLSQEMNIVDFFNKRDSTFNRVRNEKRFEVERGISLSGQFKTDKGKPKKTKLTIVQGNLDDMAHVDTDDQGQFWISGFHFFDSMEFAFRGMDAKRREMYGKIWLAPKDYPVVPADLPVMELSLKRREYKYLPFVPYNESDTVTILKEVAVEAKKIDEKKREFPSIGMADQVLDENFFQSTYGQDLMTALEGHVSGLRLVWNDQGYMVRLGGGFNTLGKSSEPLLVVDGVPDHSDQTFIEKARFYHPSMIKRVEVYRLGGSAIYGANGANGVIAIFTNKGTERTKSTEGYDKSLFQLETIQGFEAPKEFGVPSYNGVKRESPRPDYRSTIYWDSNLFTDSESGEVSISFYSADIETNYRVIVEGVTSAGQPIHAIALIKISN
jgi:hypothetical protein